MSATDMIRRRISRDADAYSTEIATGVHATTPPISPSRQEPADVPLYATVDLLEVWFPAVNPTNPRSKTFWKWQSQRGVVLKFALSIALAVLVLNLVGTIVMSKVWGTSRGLGTIYQGRCSQSSLITTALHVVINILSSLLLGASNLCMQRLASPTRAEVQKAHQRYEWLDIGIPSIRNIRYIDRRRLCAWLLLGFTSLPLHFL